MTYPPTDPILKQLLSEGSEHPEQLRHVLIGPLGLIQATIKTLHSRGYADPNDWSIPLPTGHPGKMMVILTKRMAS